ncbi:MAG: TSUP family transporter, partial [Desulfovibrio sp.]|nr:TSUP family transporter [Desulfovibrio sp.]
GFPIAVAGTIGYIFNGLGVAERPGFSLGFVYLPALLGIVLVSVLTAPWGVKLAHSLPVPKLKKAFAILLYVVGTRMLWNAL